MVKSERLLKSLLRVGWEIKRNIDSNKVLSREGFPDYVFAFENEEEIRARLLFRVVNKEGLRPKDL
ncbi:MAG: hypothetical protein M3367_06455 [Acidobacteriota bacterium]|nr:hypothetical protein [Acidobacteriota bacterium]